VVVVSAPPPIFATTARHFELEIRLLFPIIVYSLFDNDITFTSDVSHIELQGQIAHHQQLDAQLGVLFGCTF
jgi:hypothetical protein